MRLTPLKPGQTRQPYHRPVWAIKGAKVRYQWITSERRIVEVEGVLARIDEYGCAFVRHPEGNGREYMTFPMCDDLQPVETP